MPPLHQPPVIAVQPDWPAHAPVVVREHWLRLARIGGLGLTMCSVIAFVASVPLLYERYLAPCPSTGCYTDYQLMPNGVRAMGALGLGGPGYALYVTALVLVAALVQLVIAGIIIWRRAEDAVALLTTFALVTTIGPRSSDVLQTAYPVSALPLAILTWLGYILNILFFYLFPNGRFVPRWTRWLFAVVLALSVPLSFGGSAPWNPFMFVPLLYAVNVIMILVVPMVAQIYRYVRASTWLRRQQTKWLVFGFNAAQLGFAGLALWGQLVPSLNGSRA